MGLGSMSNDFCVGLVANGSTISAVAARDHEKAQAFAKKFGAARAYDSYQALAEDPEVEVVYVGTIHTTHLSCVKMALNAGKHVVVEKPMGINAKEVQEMVDLAREKKLFLLEAMWTRFFPAIRKAREVLASGEIGVPKYVQGDFGFVAPSEDQPHRLWDPELAGGGVLDIGCYLVSASTMVFGAVVPEKIACVGELTAKGCDKDGLLSLSWAGRGSASLLFTLTANTPEELLIVCSGGHMKIHTPAHCPVRLTVAKARGRGEFDEKVHTFELPKLPDNHSVNYPHSEGAVYEVRGVEDALRKGLLECPEYTLDESLVAVKIMDAFRQQVGVSYPCEK